MKKLNVEKEEEEHGLELPNDPVEFVIKLFNFKPTLYQEKLLRDNSKRIVVRMCRQAGKTTTIALRAIWFAVTHPRTLTLIVAPSLRQSMIMMDRVQNFLMTMPKEVRRNIIAKMQRTVIWFKNGSQIVALPCSVHLLRGYTAHQVLMDEANFFRDDETVIYNVVYPMLATTDGILIMSSTPWGKDSVFYRACNDPNYSKHVVTWREVVEAGLVKPEFIEEMRRALPLERFQREFEAQFVEDVDSYFTQDLIAKCIDSELEYYDFESYPEGEFYVGVDFGKHYDYSVVAVVERIDDVLKLVHCHQFPLETSYASIIGYVKTICDRWKNVISVYADQTGVGEYIVEDMNNAGIPNVNGIVLTAQLKQEILGYMKQLMQNGKLFIPYDSDLITEINVEKFELSKSGQIKFSHPEGTHDDMLWALALAVYASKSQPVSAVKGRSII
ncbi:MAG: terminase family protein [Nitrososphaerota archaeon]